MADVFVSYARADRALAERIVNALGAVGLSVWWDQRITPAESWDKLIETEIDGARAILVLWTANSIKSEWVRTEAEFAKQKNRLVQVTVSCEAPLAFRMRQWADLSKWPKANQAEWERCLEWMSPLVGRNLTAKPQKPPPPPAMPQPALPEPGARVVQRRDLPKPTPPTSAPSVVPKYRHVLTLEHSRDLTVGALALSEDQQFLAAANDSGDIDVWNLRTERPIAQIRTAVYDKLRVRLALGARAGRVAISHCIPEHNDESVSRVYDVATAKLLHETKIDSAFSASASPSGRYILIAEGRTPSWRRRVAVFDQLEARIVRRIKIVGQAFATSEGGTSVVTSIRESNRGVEWFRPSLLGLSARTIGKYSGADGKGYEIDFATGSAPLEPFALSPSGTVFACWARDATIWSQVYVIGAEGALLCKLGRAEQYRFLSDRLLLLRAGDTITLFDVRKRAQIGEMAVENVLWAHSIAGTRDGDMIAAGCHKGQVQIFAAPT